MRPIGLEIDSPTPGEESGEVVALFEGIKGGDEVPLPYLEFDLLGG